MFSSRRAQPFLFVHFGISSSSRRVSGAERPLVQCSSRWRVSGAWRVTVVGLRQDCGPSGLDSHSEKRQDGLRASSFPRRVRTRHLLSWSVCRRKNTGSLSCHGAGSRVLISGDHRVTRPEPRRSQGASSNSRLVREEPVCWGLGVFALTLLIAFDIHSVITPCHGCRPLLAGRPLCFLRGRSPCLRPAVVGEQLGDEPSGSVAEDAR